MATRPKVAKKSTGKNSKVPASSNGRPSSQTAVRVNQYGIPDWRLEQPVFEVVEIAGGAEVHYEIRGKLNTPVPPIPESKYMNKEQHLALYRWMVMNRRMEVALANIYK